MLLALSRLLFGRPQPLFVLLDSCTISPVAGGTCLRARLRFSHMPTGPVGLACSSCVDVKQSCMNACAQVKVWDVRMLRELHAYDSPAPVVWADISQRGMLAVGHGRRVQVRRWGEAGRGGTPCRDIGCLVKVAALRRSTGSAYRQLACISWKSCGQADGAGDMVVRE